VREEMVRNGLSREVAGRALEVFTGGRKVARFTDNTALLAELSGPLANDAEATRGLENLRDILSALQGMSVELDRFRVDVTLARGLDYYTGAVFEIVVDEPRIGALGGGGRYDNLIGMFAGRDLPTTGGSFGIERIIDVMTTLEMVTPQASPSRALVTGFDGTEESVLAAAQLVTELREQKIPSEVYLNAGEKLGKQFGYADKLGIPFALVIGPDERASGTVTVKNLKIPPPNQQTVERALLANVLRADE
jgi:histidyl-tRNA synthetase